MSIEKVKTFISRNEDLYPEYGILKDAILELAGFVEKETINRRRDTLDLLSTIASVEEIIVKNMDKLEAKKLPPTGPTRFGPVLNDGKPTDQEWMDAPMGPIPKQPKSTVEELIERYSRHIMEAKKADILDEIIQKVISDLIAEARA